MDIHQPEGLTDLSRMLTGASREHSRFYAKLIPAAVHTVKVVSLAYELAGDERPDARAIPVRDALAQITEALRVIGNAIKVVRAETAKAQAALEASNRRHDDNRRMTI